MLTFRKAVGPLLGAAFVELAAEFNVPLATFIQGVQGGLIVAIAFGSLICNSLAVKFGKRPIYLFSTLVLMVTCFWCAAAKSFASLVAARVVQGFCMGPLEALIPASIADVWWVTQPYTSLDERMLMLPGLYMSVVTDPQSSIWESLAV
jgi:MFS family permease